VNKLSITKHLDSINSSVFKYIEQEQSDEERREDDEEAHNLNSYCNQAVQVETKIIVHKKKQSSSSFSSSESSLTNAETALVDSKNSDPIIEPKRTHKSKNIVRNKMCCSKKCGCLSLIAVYISLDVLFNLFFVTFSANLTKSFITSPNISKSFHRFPSFQNFNIKTSTYDVWVVSLVRDAFLFFIILTVAIRHRFVYTFIRFIHKKYISSFLCLIMYSYAMLKMVIRLFILYKRENIWVYLKNWNKIFSFCLRTQSGTSRYQDWCLNYFLL
jgi:hypothetical protein